MIDYNVSTTFARGLFSFQLSTIKQFRLWKFILVDNNSACKIRLQDPI